MIDSERVTAIFKECLFKDEELVDGKPTIPYIVAEGIMYKTGLHIDRVTKNSEEISSMLDELPKEFHEETGGGSSFLNMCMTKDCQQWTGLHRVMDELIMLGIATNRVAYCLPREMWPSLPGAVPYIVIKKKTDGKTNAEDRNSANVHTH